MKTLRVTAVSKGDGIICEQGGNQGIGRNHQDPSGNAGLTPPGGSQRASWGILVGSSGTSEIQGGGSTAVDPPLLRNFWIPLAPLAMLLGTLNSSWAIPGAPLGALGHLSGGLGGHGEPLGNVWKLPKRVQSHFKIIEKPLFFTAFRSIEIMWNLSGGSCAASGGSLRGQYQR